MKIEFLFLYLMFSVSVFSQIEIERDVSASSGSEISNSNISISFTLGETFTSTLLNEKLITQGFQQFEFVDPSPICDSLGVQILIYPNPSVDQITFVSCSAESFSYKIFDIIGNVVFQGYSSENLINLNVSGLANGKYIFEYIRKSGEVQFLSFLKSS